MKRRAILSGLVVVTLLGHYRLAAAASDELCADHATAIVVKTAGHLLVLCEDGKTAKQFRVALGRGGTGKHEEGDGKTPLGTYPLAAPRGSDRFHKFIPIGYPTTEQASAGYTGGDVGIHGPHRLFTWLGWFNVLLDWTQGCIAVGTDSEIDDIAQWTMERRVSRVIIK